MSTIRGDGPARKAAGMHLAATARGRRRLILDAQAQLLAAALGHPAGECTSDDVVTGEPDAERPGGGKWLGTVPSQLAYAGVLERVGYRRSGRATRHSTPIAVWRLAVGPAQAAAHLARLRAELDALDRAAEAEDEAGGPPAGPGGYDLFANARE